MKSIVVFLALVASISASYNTGEVVENALSNSKLSEAQRNGLVGDILAAQIEKLSQDIVAAGLDPWDYDHFETRLALPVPTVFNAHAFAGDLHFSGLSNIVINRINFSILASRLTFDISLPAITVSASDIALAATVLNYPIEYRGHGKVVIGEIRVHGEARINIGIISGISLRDLTIKFNLGGIKSDIYANLQSNNYSNMINNLLQNTIPTVLKNNEKDINELIEHYAKDIIEGILA